MDVINALAANIPGIVYSWNLVFMYAGAIMVGMSIMGFFSTRNDPQRGLLVISQTKMFLFGGVLLGITFWIDTLSVSVFDDSLEARSIFSYQPMQGGDSIRVMVDFAVNLFRAIGVLIFGKGLVIAYERLMRKGNDATWPKAFVTTIVGVLLMSILKTSDIAAESSGMENLLRRMLQ